MDRPLKRKSGKALIDLEKSARAHALDVAEKNGIDGDFLCRAATNQAQHHATVVALNAMVISRGILKGPKETSRAEREQQQAIMNAMFGLSNVLFEIELRKIEKAAAE